MTAVTVETFEIDGKEYTAKPDMKKFLKEAGVAPTDAAQTKMGNTLKKAGYETPETLFGLFQKEIMAIDGVSDAKGKKIHTHANRVMRKGGLLMEYEAITERESTFKYLPTSASELDRMMTYNNGQVGFRSKTMIELYGEAAMGKTQICLTTACMVMRPKDVGGWDQGVAYIDSEGAFEMSRFKRMARYWGVEIDSLKDKFLYARALNFDDVEAALDQIAQKIEKMNIGIIIIDSIMDPLKSQYPVGGAELSNLQPRQKHLKKVLDRLKTLAELNNLVTIYTNHMRSNIGNYGPKASPQGGSVIAHASDIRIYLSPPNSSEKTDRGLKDTHERLKVGRAKIVDCGFLAETTGFYLIGPMGVADTMEYEKVAMHTKKIDEKGYICVDSLGNDLDPLPDDSTDIEKRVSRYRKFLYGEPTDSKLEKTAKNKGKAKK